MEPVPDFQHYSREQLLDALRHINREQHPAEFAALTEELRKRKELPTLTNQKVSSPSILALIVAISLVEFGIFLGFRGLQLFVLVLFLPSPGVLNDPNTRLGFGFAMVYLMIAALCLLLALLLFLRWRK